MAFPKIPFFKSTLLLCIVCAHFALLYLLYFYSPSQYTPASYVREQAQQQITQITFISREKAKPLVIQKPFIGSTAPNRLDTKNNSVGMQAQFKESTAQHSQINESNDTDLKPLNLNLPELAIDFSPKDRDLLERPRNPIDYQTTQFNGSWKPSGNAVDSLKWKSKTFNFITGILGGNQRICTDEDRKNRLPECVPDAYQPED